MRRLRVLRRSDGDYLVFYAIFALIVFSVVFVQDAQLCPLGLRDLGHSDLQCAGLIHSRFGSYLYYRYTGPNWPFPGPFVTRHRYPRRPRRRTMAEVCGLQDVDHVTADHMLENSGAISVGISASILSGKVAGRAGRVSAIGGLGDADPGHLFALHADQICGHQICVGPHQPKLLIHLKRRPMARYLRLRCLTCRHGIERN